MAKSVGTGKRETAEDTHLLPAGSRPALSGWPMVFAWAGMIIFALHASTHMVGAGDTWVALACGRHFINHGVDTVEPFSANSHHAGPTPEEVEQWPGWARWITKKVGLETVKKWHPTGWINQNWLTHVLFYWLSHESPIADAQNRSYDSLVYWKFAVYIVMVICVYYTGRVLGVNAALSAAFACFALFVGRSYFDIRPAGFSNLFVAVFILILAAATYRSIRYIWLVVPLVVLWSNLHGGYIYAFIILVPFFTIHLLLLLPRRWTAVVYSGLLWVGLYGITYRFLARPPLTPVEVFSDKVFYLVVVLVAAAVVLGAMKAVKTRAVYGYLLCALIVVFVALLGRYFPEDFARYADKQREYVRDFRRTFFLMFLGGTLVAAVVVFLKDRIVRLRRRDLYHIAGAGVTAFAAMIILNPFHLTNLTHTFVISVSENAEQWRTVNEWHPAFEWTNPVGTSFTFLVMLILCVGLGVFWLWARFLKPRYLKGSKVQLESDRERFIKLSRVFGISLAVFLYWTLFISLSFMPLDVGGFFVGGLFAGIILLSVFKSVHFIYFEIPLILMAMWAAGPEHNFVGIYNYPFVLLPLFVVTHIIASRFSTKVRFTVDQVFIVGATALVSVFLMTAIFNPFKFNQSVWHLGQFLDIQRQWQPVYEGKYPVDYTHLFPVLYVINAVSVIIWLARPVLWKFLVETAGIGERGQQEQPYERPNADLVLMLIAALTVYMAIRSRRFIPIAAAAACPVLALLVQQTVHGIAAAGSFHGLWSSGAALRRHLRVPAMDRGLELLCAAMGSGLVVFLGIYWSVRFKTVYLDPWPTDPEFTSVFMRMTASDAKPFHAGDFIRLNHLQGNMFNYWTEGGFIAYAQQPDPNTGKTPLQLFMDGRAQAAYDRRTYDTWQNIMAGGPITGRLQQAARLRGRGLNRAEYVKIGDWITKQLTNPRYNVWVVLMPAGEFSKPFVRALDYHPDWQLAFFNNKQKLFVNARTPQGKALLDGIWTGETVYPEKFSENLIKAHRRLKFGKNAAEHKEGLEFARRALEIHPSGASMQTVLRAAAYQELRGEVIEVCRRYFERFDREHEELSRQDGYHHRLVAAIMAADYLERVARFQNQKEKAAMYKAKSKSFRAETPRIVETKRW